jgi:outer membrane protein TolC
MKRAPVSTSCIACAALCATLTLAGCINVPAGAPPSAEKLWRPPNMAAYSAAVTGAKEVRLSSPGAAGGAIEISDARPYDLAELIDIAQRTNPETRMAWERARQAAINAGIVEGTYYPMLAVHASAFHQRVASPIPKSVDPRGFFLADTEALLPRLTLKWLLFDFGGREASLEAAKEQLVAANFGFNARHQKIVFDVTRAYYSLNAVRGKVEVARSALRSAQTLQEAAESRRRQGLATLPEVLQAREQSARAVYEVEEAAALEVDARMALLEVMGIRPSEALRVADLSRQPLPATLEQAADKFVDIALENRPDVLARVAVLRAKDAEIRKARSEFYPRISALADAGQNIGRVRVNGDGWSTVNQPQYGFGVALELPLFDAGLRDNRRRLAESERRVAEDDLNLSRDRTVREVIKAYNDVKVAFRKREAAVALLEAAERAHESVLASYRNGIATFVDMVNAQTNLTRARTADTETRSLVFTASAALAFSTGEIVPQQTTDGALSTYGLPTNR